MSVSIATFRFLPVLSSTASASSPPRMRCACLHWGACPLLPAAFRILLLSSRLEPGLPNRASFKSSHRSFESTTLRSNPWPPSSSLSKLLLSFQSACCPAVWVSATLRRHRKRLHICRRCPVLRCRIARCGSSRSAAPSCIGPTMLSVAPNMQRCAAGSRCRASSGIGRRLASDHFCRSGSGARGVRRPPRRRRAQQRSAFRCTSFFGISRNYIFIYLFERHANRRHHHNRNTAPTWGTPSSSERVQG